MARPNVQYRTRTIGFTTGQVNGTTTNTSGTGIAHGITGGVILNPGASNDSFGFQVNHAILGGASILSVGNSTPPNLVASRTIAGVHDTHCVYAEVFAHMRSAGDVDLPGTLRFFFNELWPDPVAVPNPTQFDIGDWVTSGWQEWEDWSPLTIPTPPPGFSSGGPNGVRYEYRRVLGRVPGNFIYMSLKNAGSVAATEFGYGLILRSEPPVYTR